MAKTSAGILMYRWRDGFPEIFLVHPGGPYWARKDEHAWSIPKGEIVEGEDPETAARREFGEETGHSVDGSLTALAEIRSSSQKRIHVFMTEGELDPSTVSSNDFEMEWPPRSGQMQSFPEVDKAAWYSLDVARNKLHKGQVQIVDLLNGFLAE